MCASLVVDLDVSPIATLMIKNGHTHMAQWNKRVPDQWVGVGAGSWGGVLTEAPDRKYTKRKVYWVLIGSKRGGEAREMKGSLTVRRVGEWGLFSDWSVAS